MKTLDQVFEQTIRKARTPKGGIVPLFKVFMPSTIQKPLVTTLFSGYIGQGPKVEIFEQKLGRLIKNPYVVTVNTGTSGLHLAYHLCIDKSEAEIITTPMTCAATNIPILNTKQAKIVWADINPKTGLIDPHDIKRKITKRTRAIVMVHWGGNPAEIDEINKLAREYKIKTIEDAAHGFGTRYQGKMLGEKTSDFVIYSFQAIKNINTVDGGVLVCKSKTDYQRAKLLRWYGIDRESKQVGDFRCEKDIVEAGYKFHMNDVSATIGLEMLPYLPLVIGRHRENSLYYQNHLKCESVLESKQARSSCWLHTVLLPKRKRDAFIEYMLENKIQVSKVHVRNDIHSVFKKFRVSLPGVDEFNNRHCCLPVGWWVSRAELKKITKLVNQFL
ncbi:MAG: aminotransferase class V-fold PLP-dependent enzyme [Patescibacteria group bacterium]|nr:aminotransferase class V-fold PLP-dependent enzyme [Patescibacteria group bacterium]